MRRREFIVSTAAVTAGWVEISAKTNLLPAVGIRSPTTRQDDLLNARRANTIARLQEQKQLLADPNYVRIEKNWKTINGEPQQIEKQRRVHPWWETAPTGSVVLFVRLGGKPIEFDMGKSGIAVASTEKLPGVIDTLIAAVRNGELDTWLNQAVEF